MNDPWDVKSVRQSGQYMSCMKINGVPLLPPVLSKECRKEMQYYKLLAKEVEKRISLLKPYVENDSEVSEDKTDAPELPESEQCYDLPLDDTHGGFNVNINKLTAITCQEQFENALLNATADIPFIQEDYSKTSNIVVTTADATSFINPPKLVIDLSLSINETGKNILETNKNSPEKTTPIELPERDYNSKTNTCKELLTEFETNKNDKKSKVSNKINKVELDVDNAFVSEQFPEVPINQDGPSSLSSKSFTGSLNDLHTDSMKESQIVPKLLRQRSYTLLKPGPQLLAHLEVQSLNTGVEMSNISMSESISNLSSPTRKRRSWDLESAKIKWSSMALELKEKNVTNIAKTSINKNNISKSATKKVPQTSPTRPRSMTQEKLRNGNNTTKSLPKSEPIQKTPKKHVSPVRNAQPSSISQPAKIKEQTPSKTNGQKKDVTAPKPLISESDDPATRIRELYEKIQKQQLMQMASLVEKQKREQMLLQQVFEEQNNLLFKQLKTICPKSPIEIKEAWGDKNSEPDRGPVSLSQLMTTKSPDQSLYDSPVSSTLTETKNYINHCDDVLKMSKDITSSLKKQQNKSRSMNGNQIQSRSTPGEGCRTRTHSPTSRNTSRRLNYDTSASSERECDPILTDRTNDTFADLNVTFPSDHSDDSRTVSRNDLTTHHNIPKKDLAMVHISPTLNQPIGGRSAETAIRSMEESIYNSINSMNRRQSKNQPPKRQPTAQELAAATKIVAYAKGYLVRRLMRTERVQGTVQTIKDALLCALQLHQEREGIRGADVDLHRRLIQQITAACYSLHDTFVASSPAERCAMIAADRGRRRSLAARQTAQRTQRNSDIMSQSHSGSFPTRARVATSSPMTQSNYETFSAEKCVAARRCGPSPRRRPWR